MKRIKLVKLVKLARGHEWAAGRATQTHGDRRHKRLKTRGARLREALKGEGGV